MASLLANAPPVPSWDIGTAFILQKDLSLGMGYYVQHRVGDAQPPVPDSSRGVDARIYYKDCSTPVDVSVKPEPIVFSNQQFFPLNNTFTYEFDVIPSLINDGNMTSFDDITSTGKAIGHIEFCSIVFTKLDSLDVNFRKTIFDLRFDLSDNTFDTGAEISHPQQTFSMTPNVTVNDVVNNTAPASLLTMGSVVESAITNTLDSLNQNLDSTMKLDVQSTMINGQTSSSLAGTRRLQSLMDLLVCLSIDLTFECITTEHCDKQNRIATDLMGTIQNIITNALASGDVHTEIQNEASNFGVGYFTQASLHPEDGCSFLSNENGDLIFNIGELETAIPQFFAIQILDEFTVSACQCNQNNFQCYTTPQTIAPNDLVAICLERNSPEVFIVQLEVKMEGDNGFVFYPVEFGADGYFEPHPLFTQISNFEAANILMVKTFLLAGFSLENGGATSITISGNAMLESKSSNNKHRKLPYAEILDEDFRFTLPIAVPEGESNENESESTSFLAAALRFLIIIAEFLSSWFQRG